MFDYLSVTKTMKGKLSRIQWISRFLWSVPWTPGAVEAKCVGETTGEVLVISGDHRSRAG